MEPHWTWRAFCHMMKSKWSEQKVLVLSEAQKIAMWYWRSSRQKLPHHWPFREGRSSKPSVPPRFHYNWQSTTISILWQQCCSNHVTDSMSQPIRIKRTRWYQFLCSERTGSISLQSLCIVIPEIIRSSYSSRWLEECKGHSSVQNRWQMPDTQL